MLISIEPYLTDKGEHTALYKINNIVYIKTSKRINYTVIILYFPHTHTHTQMRRRNVTRGEGVWASSLGIYRVNKLSEKYKILVNISLHSQLHAHCLIAQRLGKSVSQTTDN